MLNSVLAVATGGVKWVTIGAGGSGYLGGLSGQFALTFSTGVAAGYAVVVAGVVVNAIVTAPGAYGSAPTVSFAAGGGTGATGPAVLSTGGTIATGTYAIGVTAFDTATNPLQTPLSNLIEVTVTAPSELAINLTWPAGSYGGDVYVASPDASHAFHYESAPGAGGATSGVANYDLTAVGGVFFGPPDPLYDHMLIRCKRDIHAGSWAEPCSSVGLLHDYLGRCDLHHKPVRRPLRFPARILGPDQNDSKCGTPRWCRTPQPHSHYDTRPAQSRLVMSLSRGSTRPLTTSTSFTDADGISCFEPTGDAAHAESGNVARIVRGPGAGQQRLIQDNTAGNAGIHARHAVGSAAHGRKHHYHRGALLGDQLSELTRFP